MKEMHVNTISHDIKITFRSPHKVLPQCINYRHMEIEEDKHGVIGSEREMEMREDWDRDWEESGNERKMEMRETEVEKERGDFWVWEWAMLRRVIVRGKCVMFYTRKGDLDVYALIFPTKLES